MRVRTLLGPLLAIGGAVAFARRRSRPDPLDLWLDEAPTEPPAVATPPVAVASHRGGDRSQRGRGGTVTMDLDRARSHHVEPVVEFLTYVQTRRGDESHLLFVRNADLDAMAAAADEPVDRFLDRLDQLGVVVSTN